MADGEKLLVVFDFDHTLVDANTDTWVTKLGDEALHRVQATWEEKFSCWTGKGRFVSVVGVVCLFVCCCQCSQCSGK